MAIRVAHVGTGNVGRLALIGLVTNPAFELTGLCVSSPEKVGKDAGALAGLDISTGVAAVGDLDPSVQIPPKLQIKPQLNGPQLREHPEREPSQDAGVPVHTLRKIAGHGTLTTTQRYLHPTGSP